jgi:hypothetical protein
LSRLSPDQAASAHGKRDAGAPADLQYCDRALACARAASRTAPQGTGHYRRRKSVWNRVRRRQMFGTPLPSPSKFSSVGARVRRLPRRYDMVSEVVQPLNQTQLTETGIAALDQMRQRFCALPDHPIREEM